MDLEMPSIGCPMHVNRRDFLSGCVSCAAGVSALAAAVAPAIAAGETAAASPSPSPAAAKAKVALIFSHIPPGSPTWPNIGYDYEGRKKQILEALTKGCPDVEFAPVTVHNADEARKAIEGAKEMDGIVNYLVGIWTGTGGAVCASGKPAILVDDLYAGSGEFLIEYSRAKRAGQKVVGISSSEMDDVVEAVNTFAAIKKLQASTILVITGSWDAAAQGKVIKDTFGVNVKQIDPAELEEAYKKVDPNEAKTWATRWIKGAEKVIEPTPEEIHKSAAFYLAMRSVLARHNAQAITINCLGLFYGGKLSAYPCLGFWQLNNDGFVGACESDLRSTVSMLITTTLTGRPGYISDPVIDTSKNQIIYAHCVAPSKVFGPAGRDNPYHIRSHSEDRKGACIRSLMPLDEITTTLEWFAERREVLVHQGKTVENVDEDKACRTKLAVEVRDARQLLSEWDVWGWHRVTFYGDLLPQVQRLACLWGIKVVGEGPAWA